MKKLALLLSLVLAAGVASAQSAPPAQPAPAAPAAQPAAQAQPAPAAPAAKTSTVEGEVVSADATAKTITIKGDKENKTMAVDTAAAGSLKTLKAGDKVKLTCRDDAMGGKQTVTEIKVDKPKVQ